MNFNNKTVAKKANLHGTNDNAWVCVYFDYLPFSHSLFDQFGKPTVCRCFFFFALLFKQQTSDVVTRETAPPLVREDESQPPNLATAIYHANNLFTNQTKMTTAVPHMF